jgi:RimJ/RimL family protein N-acetyltransferase
MRAWDGRDRDAFAAMNRDPRVMEHLVKPLTREESDAFVDRMERCWQDLGYGLWAVERTDLGRFIGYVGLWPATFEAAFTPAVEVGWRLAAEHWGHGFATEAAHRALRFGFQVVGLAKIVSFTAVGNVRSWRVMERLGMQQDPDGFDHPLVPEGHPLRRHVLYRISTRRYAQVHGWHVAGAPTLQ